MVLGGETNLWQPGDVSQKENFFTSWGHQLQDQWVSWMMSAVTHCLLFWQRYRAGDWTVASRSDSSCSYSDLFLDFLTVGAGGGV